MTEAVKAYYMGRNDVWNGFPREPERAGRFQAEYKQGWRDAAAEMRLDADTEWDD
jgi:hypothetical protein